MASLVLTGDTSGQVTISAPAVAGTTALTLQAVTGTMALQNDVIGINQTWTDVKTTPGRVFGTTYTNTTGRPIWVTASGTNTGTTAGLQMTVGGLQVFNHGDSDGGMNNGNYFCVTGLVPAGSTYVVTANGSLTISTWVELR